MAQSLRMTVLEGIWISAASCLDIKSRLPRFNAACHGRGVSRARGCRHRQENPDDEQPYLGTVIEATDDDKVVIVTTVSPLCSGGCTAAEFMGLQVDDPASRSRTAARS